MNRTAGEIAKAIGARVIGDEAVQIGGVASIASAKLDDLVFVDDEKHLESALHSKAAAIIVGVFAASAKKSKPLLISSHPRLAFARAATLLRDPNQREPEIHTTAVLMPSAVVAGTVTIDAWSFVGAEASIGQRTWIGAGCVIGSGVVIGEDCKIIRM